MTTNFIDSSNKDFLAGLSCFQRLLMVTDGTVTEMLEQFLQEKIQVHKLHEAIVEQVSLKYSTQDCLGKFGQSKLLERQVLLRGQHTGRNWVYAESVIILEHLPKAFREDLCRLKEPIGRLWEKYRIETFKEVLHFCRFESDELAGYFDISSPVEVIARTYAVYSGGRLIMLISEIFPASFFREEVVVLRAE